MDEDNLKITHKKKDVLCAVKYLSNEVSHHTD
jgi:hypothetical protein